MENVSGVVVQIDNIQSLMAKKAKLIKELKETDKEIEEIQSKCNHIPVVLGFYGSYLCRDSSICECLLCREDHPEGYEYKGIDASYYKSRMYGHGAFYNQKDERMENIQNTIKYLADKNPEMTVEELIDSMDRIITEDVETEKKVLEKIRNNN